MVGRKGTAGEVVWCDTDFFPIDTTYYVDVDTDIHSIRWLYYVLRHADLGLLQASTGVPGLSRSDANKLILPVPGKDEQARIAAFLSKVDETITKTQASIDAAQKLKRGLMQNLLTGKLKPGGTWRRDDEFDIDPKFGRVPKGWEPKKLKTIFKLKNGKGNTTDNLRTSQDDEFNIPVFGGNGITGYFDKPLVTRRSLIIGRVGEYCGSVYLTPEKAWVTDNAMLAWEFMQEVSVEYLTYWLINANLGRLAATTGQPKLTQGDIGKLVLIGPPSENDQAEIATAISRFDDLLFRKQEKLDTLHRLKLALMQNLLTGKVRIPPDLKIE